MTRHELLTAFGMSLIDLAHKMRRRLDSELRPLGLSLATWRTLHFVSSSVDGLMQKDLALAIGIEGPSLVRLLDNLEGEGLIERRVAPEDRRGKTVHLTPAGKLYMADIQRTVDRVREALLDGVPDDEIETILAAFDHIRANAEDHTGDNGEDGGRSKSSAA